MSSNHLKLSEIDKLFSGIKLSENFKNNFINNLDNENKHNIDFKKLDKFLENKNILIFVCPHRHEVKFAETKKLPYYKCPLIFEIKNK